MVKRNRRQPQSPALRIRPGEDTPRQWKTSLVPDHVNHVTSTITPAQHSHCGRRLGAPRSSCAFPQGLTITRQLIDRQRPKHRAICGRPRPPLPQASNPRHRRHARVPEEPLMNGLEVLTTLAHQLLPADRLIKMSFNPCAQAVQCLFLVRRFVGSRNRRS